ncbi:hypothetical protein ABL78_5925 [Leptomonas seymouri]|uniref:WW domain-containing protein n=1 Tax=Leptomonas seymouri TaxID=5684 RepID=A0A0N0P489_LEPSE|nr:hypothetical protein ABL78_5925 [Leptomonas seymouri]|eukprot:KPI85016.1 hypothetical protein ABL78_5925 [Leptomonas seymouri]
MTHPRQTIGATGLDAAPSMSHVPPYRVYAHTYIAEQLATATAGQTQALGMSPDPTTYPRSSQSPSTSPYSAQEVRATAVMNALSMSSPPLQGMPNNAATAKPLPPPLSVQPFTSNLAPITSPAAPYHHSPSPQMPSPAPAAPFSSLMAAPSPATATSATPTSPPPTAIPVAAAAPLPLRPSTIRSSHKAPCMAHFPQLRIVLARGRLSGIAEFGPDATGEAIYRAFCPAGDTYPNDHADGPTVSAAAAPTTATTSRASLTVCHEPPTPSETASTMASGEMTTLAPNGSAEASNRSCWTAQASATRGRLPPGWERRLFLNTTFYLDHISREAHDQEPWVVWWGRAGNADMSIL